MNHRQIEALAEANSDLVKELLTPLLDHIAALSARLASIEAERKKDNSDVIMKMVAAAVAEFPKPVDGKDGADGRDGVDGKDGASVTVAEVVPLITEQVTQVFAASPVPKDGKDGADGRDGVDGKDGASVTVADVVPLITEQVTQVFAASPVPKDGKDGADGRDGVDGKDGTDGLAGKDADPAAVRLMVAEEVAKIPAATNGKDGADGRDGVDGKDADPEVIVQLVEAEVAKIPAPANGKDADPEEMARLITAEVEKAFASRPIPADGKSVTVDDVQPVLEELVAKKVAALPKPKDGVGLTGGLIDRNGVLVLTLSDGTTKDLGVVVGKDADPAEIARVIVEEVAKIPRPKDGKDGDGINNIEAFEDEFKYGINFGSGDEITKLRWQKPTVADRYIKVWRDGAYLKGTTTTLEGSLFIALRDTSTKPGVSGSDWVLAVKRGRDGKDGRDGRPGERGLEGKPGKDLTQLGPDGSKW